MASHLCLSLVSVILFVTLFNCGPADAIVNNKIDRIIDLSSQLVKITERIHIEESVGLYKITLDPSHKSRLAYLDATINGQQLNIIEKPDGSYEIDLTGQTAKPLVVTSVFTRLLQPYPAEIKQNDRQLVRYQGLQSTLSPYLTKTVTTRIKLPQGSRLESFTKASKMTTGTNKLTYGPLKDVQPNQAQPIVIHFENNTPFVAVTDLQRTIEVAPWTQSIHVMNQIKVAHVGAKLKGPFSRLDYQRDHNNGISSVRNFAAELPKASRDISFRDGIGNISTSTVKHTSASTIVGVKPRFPLFGGWVTDFNLGYKIPIGDHVNEPVSGNNHRLSIPFADVLYDNMFIEDATVRITLPAGASQVEVKGSVEFQRLPDEINYSYLDVIGRPVVVLSKKNIVSQHLDGKPLVIRYNYTRFFMLQEPLLLLGVALICFAIQALYKVVERMQTRNEMSTEKKNR